MNSIVFNAPGCPLSHLGPYGNEWVATPNLDRLAAEGVVFDRHFASRPGPFATRDTRKETKARTILIRNFRADYEPTRPEGFAEVLDFPPEDSGPWSSLLRQLPAILDRLDGKNLVIETDRMLPPWFAPRDVFEVYCEDLIEEGEAFPDAPEPWLDPPSGKFDRDDLTAWEWLHRTVAAAVTSFDADLGRAFQILREKGFDQSSSWWFTADHGLPLGEHGTFGIQSPRMFAEYSQIPAIVRLPNGASNGERIAGFTQPEDLVRFGERERPPRDFVVSSNESHASIRTETHALLIGLAADSPDPQLFLKPDDQRELNDIRQAHFELADELEAKLRLALAANSKRIG